MLAALLSRLITTLARAITGARALWKGLPPSARAQVYFGNHSSHIDFLLIWSSLPPALRKLTRPVAGADYWERGAVKRYLIHRVFRGLLIDRQRAASGAEGPDPIEQMATALDGGDSLILFPEGTRNQAEGLLPFKSGLYHLARARPHVELVPVWLDNLSRVMPKGRTVPLPLLCTVSFGAPVTLAEGETKQAFLDRARAALLALAPPEA